MNEKLEQLILLTEKKKQIDEAIEILKEELKPSIEKEKFNWYLIYKTSRPSYKIKKEVDLVDLSAKYPECLKLDAAKLYKIADDVESIMDISWSESLTVKKEKDDWKSDLKEF